jgi:nucleoside-diphosphate-sugar epimerase
MKYVVTGGAGFIGSHIVENLLSNNNEVTVIDNFSTGKEGNINPFRNHPNVKIISDSITNNVYDILDNVDGIFHNAASVSVPRSIKNPLLTNYVNVIGTLNLLMAAQQYNVKKIVFASSSSIYGDTITLPKHETMAPSPKSPYALSKLIGEQCMDTFHNLYNINTISLRYFNVFGPRQDPTSEYSAVIPKFITSILSHQPITIYGDGTQTRDFTYVDDVVQANTRAMHSNANGIFNIAYNNQTSLNDLAEMIMDITDINIPIIYKPSRAGDVQHSRADIQKAQLEFNYSPQYTVESGLKKTIKWYQDQDFLNIK